MINKKALFMAAALASLGGACASDTIDTGSVDDVGGKADDATPAIAVAPTDETLWSRSLRTELCDSIAGAAAFDTIADRTAFEDGCQDHDFTITERRTSTLYAHQDDLAPLTMGMTVKVSDGRSDYVADLDRHWRPASYRFAWEVTPPSGRQDRDAYISDLADEIGEYFDGWGDERFRAIALADIPGEVMAVAEARAQNTTEEWRRDQPDSTDGAGVYDEAFEILGPDGEVAGYVIMIEYYIDDTLFDGGGETLYMDKLGRVVEGVEWWG